MADSSKYDARFSSSVAFSNVDSSPTSKKFKAKYDIILQEEPVVVLLGWGGCKERHLSKYSSIYGKQGCTTLMYIGPSDMLISTNSRKILTTNAKKIVNLLEEMELIEKPLFFHCFSNGGALMYDLIREVLLKRNEIYNIRGCIFDSGPAEVKLSYVCRMLSTMIPTEAYTRYILAIAIFLRLHVIYLYNWILSYFIDNEETLRRQSVWHSLIHEPNICPQLFLFSRDDDVCDFKSIQNFIAHRKDRDVIVDFYRWDQTPHVCHYRYYPDQYERIVLDFVARNLE
ncbi:transmembrane protein 53-like [Centruroides sculpturatus]|uniref:transmembrane protein 53-like n=1 Tax=Centruroides sculpturatus TaxID=218467 RepID=UPI000C6E5F7B|nr:transmembrane protein 53-like [Centruroides sculpturatus]